jgi:hypothetical protein
MASLQAEYYRVNRLEQIGALTGPLGEWTLRYKNLIANCDILKQEAVI